MGRNAAVGTQGQLGGSEQLAGEPLQEIPARWERPTIEAQRMPPIPRVRDVGRPPLLVEPEGLREVAPESDEDDGRRRGADDDGRDEAAPCTLRRAPFSSGGASRRGRTRGRRVHRVLGRERRKRRGFDHKLARGIGSHRRQGTGGAGDAGVADGRGRDWAFQHSVMGECPAMELHEAIRRRAMVRSFSDEPVQQDVLERILSDALRSPTAGNTRGTAWVVLEGPEQTAVYFGATTDEEWRRQSRRWEGLRRAPVVLLAYSCPDLYVARYGEPDKVGSGLGGDRRRGRSPTGSAMPHSGSWRSSWVPSMPGWEPASWGPSEERRRSPSDSASPRDGGSSLPWPWASPTATTTPRSHSSRNGPDHSERIHLGGW